MSGSGESALFREDHEELTKTKRLDGRIALITGGTTGIGLATARRFHDEGATVLVTGRNPEGSRAGGRRPARGHVASQALSALLPRPLPALAARSGQGQGQRQGQGG